MLTSHFIDTILEPLVAWSYFLLLLSFLLFAVAGMLSVEIACLVLGAPRRWAPPVPLYRLPHGSGVSVAEERVETRL
jgi:hypothetical protein